MTETTPEQNDATSNILVNLPPAAGITNQNPTSSADPVPSAATPVEAATSDFPAKLEPEPSADLVTTEDPA